MTATIAQVRKEVRVLGTGWFACLVAVATAGTFDNMPATLATVAYAVGPVALGALSIGHEYTHRTMSHLLAQPVSRAHVLAIKIGVLGVMLLTLWATAGWSLTIGGRLDRDPTSGFAWATWVFPILAGACLAPWFTLLCRSALAGLVFAMATPAAIWIVAVLVAVVRFGVDGANGSSGDRFRLGILWTGMLAASVTGAVLTWHRFLRLETLDGRGADLELPAWLRRRADAHAGRRRPALWQLAMKELRLQQMTFIVSLLFAACWLLWPLLQEALPSAMPAGSLPALAVAHGAFISLLAGSLASAEEREYGTREWQLLLPMAASRQWMVKAGTTFVVTLGLAIALPLALNVVSSAGPITVRRGVDLVSVATAVAILTAGGLYVSSLSASGIRAVMASVITLPVAAAAANWLMNTSLWLVWSAASAMDMPRPVPGSARWITSMNAAILVALLVRAGLANHHLNAVPPTQVVRQVLAVAGWIVAATVVATIAG